MKRSLAKKLCLAAGLALVLAGSFCQAAFTQLNRVSFRDAHGPITENWDDSFKDHGTKINISLPMGNKGQRVFTVKEKEQIVYQHPVSHSDESYMMEQIRDDRTGRIFYVLHTGKQGGYIFGYDQTAGRWYNYADVQHYAPYIYYDFSGITLKNGQLDLYFQQSYAPYANHAYRLFWDERARWFGYDDLGLRYHVDV